MTKTHRSGKLALLVAVAFSLSLGLCAAGARAVEAAPPTAGGETAAVPFPQPPLPYAKDALAPTISAETLEYHYGKHQKTYVDLLNKLVEGKPEAQMSLEDIIVKSPPGQLFNSAAQVWNHTFYWNSLKPKGGGEPTGKLAEAIKRDFGSYAKFKEEFTRAASTLFGSGYAWLVLDGDKLKVVQTSNADTPMKHNQTALLTMDVWEHAYYIDYRNARPKHVVAVIDNLINWDFAAANYAKATDKQ